MTIVERAAPGMGCSYGNAGIIATSEVFPIISPRRVLSLPLMLCDREGPAVIRGAGWTELLPWLLRASTTLAPARQKAISSALAGLNGAALSAWRVLLADIGATNLLFERGMIEVLRSPACADDLRSNARRLAEVGLRARLLSGDEVRELEPAIGPTCTGGLFHEGTAHVRDPFEVCGALLTIFRKRGGQLIHDDVIAVGSGNSGQIVHGRAAPYPADMVVIAAGMASGALLRPCGATVPLQAERGYHLMLPGAPALSRPLTFHRESCVATPLGSGLRLAGTVEFARPDASPDWSRADRLASFAQRYFREALPENRTVRWMGSRPSLPDSLPAIGLHPERPNLAYAFGHQHLGLTQAAITATHVADLLMARRHGASLIEFDLRRFRPFRKMSSSL